MKVISLVNQKGGVAKTTTSIALADGFARRGKKVLIIDFDPQAHLTTSFGLSDDAQCPQALRFLNILQNKPFGLHVINKNLSIITSEIGLEQANTILQTKIGRERFLAHAIKKLSANAFDYIIIDSNPSLSILTVNVLAASDYILIPFKPEFNSFKGVDLLLESVSDVKTMYPQIEILGFVVTMADKRRRSTAESIEVNYPIILDIWKRGEQHNNSNIVVIGKSGSGKSFFTNTLITNLYSDNVQIFVLDPENEYNILCENVGGKYVDVGNASVGRINPLHIFQTLSDDGIQSEPEVVYSAHLRFLEDFFKITMDGITSDSLEELNNNIVALYESRNIKPTTDVSGFSPKQFPTFDDLLAVINKEITKEKRNKDGVSRLANLERIMVYLEKFAKGGRYAQLWNGASTLESDENFIVFNFQSLFASKNYLVINAQMLLLLRYLEQKIINIREINRNNPDQNIHPIIVIDEGHSFINEKYPVALDFIHNEFKRIRKYNGSMMFLTQNFADILGNQNIVAQTSAIINNSQYSFIFGLNPADVIALEELYKSSGGINATERNAIATASRGDCFAVHSARERSLFRVEATETVRRLFMERGITFDAYQHEEVVDTDDTTE